VVRGPKPGRGEYPGGGRGAEAVDSRQIAVEDVEIARGLVEGDLDGGPKGRAGGPIRTEAGDFGMGNRGPLNEAAVYVNLVAALMRIGDVDFFGWCRGGALHRDSGGGGTEVGRAAERVEEGGAGIEDRYALALVGVHVAVPRIDRDRVDAGAEDGRGGGRLACREFGGPIPAQLVIAACRPRHRVDNSCVGGDAARPPGAADAGQRVVAVVDRADRGIRRVAPYPFGLAVGHIDGPVRLIDGDAARIHGFERFRFRNGEDAERGAGAGEDPDRVIFRVGDVDIAIARTAGIVDSNSADATEAEAGEGIGTDIRAGREVLRGPARVEPADPIRAVADHVHVAIGLIDAKRARTAPSGERTERALVGPGGRGEPRRWRDCQRYHSAGERREEERPSSTKPG
jgi:hypothetical protein